MKRWLAMFVLGFVVLTAGTLEESEGFPGVDSCTAAMIGHAVAVSNYNSCRNAGPSADCSYEWLAATWAAHRVLNYCFGVEF